MRAWLFAIMHNVFVYQVRSGSQRQHVEAEYDNGEPSPATAGRAQPRCATCSARSNGWPPEQREVILLVGGRLLPGDKGPAAQFMYQDSGGARLTLYVSLTG